MIPLTIKGLFRLSCYAAFWLLCSSLSLFAADTTPPSVSTTEITLDPDSLTGIYVLNPGVSPTQNFTKWAGSTLTNPDIEGYAMKFKWRDLQPKPTTYNWDFMLNDIKIAAANNKKTFLWVMTVWHAPEWIYEPPYNVTKFLYKDRDIHSDPGYTILQDAQLPLPWDSTYISEVKSFLTALKDRLTHRGGDNDLTDAEYDTIVKINVANPGGTKDTFGMHTGEDKKGVFKDRDEVDTAIDTRVPECANNACDYFHNYDDEWQEGKYVDTNGDGIQYTITTDVYSDAKLYNASKEIADYTASAFPDKFIGRTIFFSPARTSFAQSALESFVSYLTENSSYKDRIVLQDNSLDADSVKETDSNAKRYTPLEYHRLKNQTLIGFEALWSSENPKFNERKLPYPLRQALINAIDRGADWAQIYKADAVSTSTENIEAIQYAKNLVKNLSPDETSPTDVSITSAGPGANPGELKIDFIAPGDDYDPLTSQPAGEVKEYIVKYSTSPITSSNFDSAPTYPQNWVPTRAGRAEGDGTQIVFNGNSYVYSKVLTGLTPGQLYYVAIKAKDDVGKISTGFVEEWSGRTADITPSSGDLNADGKVNITDIQLCVKVIIGTETNPEIVQRAKEVAAPLDKADIKDIQGIVRIILGGG